MNGLLPGIQLAGQHNGTCCPGAPSLGFVMDFSNSMLMGGALLALLVGMSKTGVPGLGILVVPVMALLFPVRLSVGALLPLLIAADVMATLFYRRHAQWPVLVRMLPWTYAGIAAASLVLWQLGDRGLAPLLGLLVLVMIVLELIRRRSGWNQVPHAPWFTHTTGLAVGFTTTLGNVAGPVMNIYLVARGFSKEHFMGTLAWFFLIVNISKVPVYGALGLLTVDTLRFDALMLPFVILGGLLGRWLLPRIPQKLFEVLVLVLAALAAVRLILP